MPYYLSQIYYKTGDIDQLLSVGESLLAQAVPSRAAGVAKLIGEGYYQKSDWKEAALYLEKHKELGGKLSIQDNISLDSFYTRRAGTKKPSRRSTRFIIEEMIWGRVPTIIWPIVT